MSTFYYLVYPPGSCAGFCHLKEAEDSAVNIALHIKENVEIWRGKIDDISGDVHIASVPYSLAKQAWRDHTTDVSLLEIHYPEAYNALPESYKNDSCLSFYLTDDFSSQEPNKELRAKHDLGETFAFRDGEWIQICDWCECLYIPDTSYDGYPRCSNCGGN
jgi:hypothetical protein